MNLIQDMIARLQGTQITPIKKVEDSVDSSPEKQVEDQTDSIKNWFIVADSVIGKSHIVNNVPCQDNCFNKVLSNGWGVAVVCDGAGSASNSHIGSAFIAQEALPRYFEELIFNRGWKTAAELPSYEDWSSDARQVLKQANGALVHLAENQGYDFSSLACTAIVVLYSPLGLLVTHIGDGRAGYCDQAGNWSSMITPHKGEEANQTIFITSGAWIADDNFTMSGVLVPESRVIPVKPGAFTLLSDGCEYHSFQCSKMNPEGNWNDPNQPYPQFFDPIVKTLKDIATSKESSLSAQESWKQFLEAGTEGLKNEPDDKTIILGVAI